MPQKPAKPNTVAYPALDLGPLPAAAINAALGTELEPGRVHLSAGAHRHMAKDHPDDYQICLASLGAAIASPTYVGQAPGHVRNFEVIKRIRTVNDRSVLVAISIDVDAVGRYRVRTSYLVENEKIDTRRRQGRLRIPTGDP